MSTTNSGTRAIAAAASYFEMRGYTIIEMNYRRPRCEIDIIAKKDDVMHFVEVKFRMTDRRSDVFEATTKAKLMRMQGALEIWLEETEWPGKVVLSTIELQGPDLIVMNYIKNVN
jgi:Holliday junction resolvase-like predicted endonuclease